MHEFKTKKQRNHIKSNQAEGNIDPTSSKICN